MLPKWIGLAERRAISPKEAGDSGSEWWEWVGFIEVSEMRAVRVRERMCMVNKLGGMARED